jgi:hypothetical protein
MKVVCRKPAKISLSLALLLFFQDGGVSQKTHGVIQLILLDNIIFGSVRPCSARDWERSGLLEENPQSGCSDICASLKGPL